MWPVARIIIASVAVVHGTPNSPKDYEKLLIREPEDTALCVVDVGQAAISLGMAGTSIQAAAKLCRPPFRSKEARRECSAAVNTVLYMFAYTGAFLSGAASDCARTLNLPAYCAADVTNLIGSFAALGAAASSMTRTCDLHPSEDDLPGWAKSLGALKDGMQKVNKLKQQVGVLQNVTDALTKATQARTALETLGDLKNATQALSKLPRPRDTETPFNWKELHEAEDRKVFRQLDIANCVFHSAFAATFLARAGLALNAGVRDCNPFALHLNHEAGQMACAVDVSGVIGSFAWTARVLSGAIAECPVVKVSKQALCVGDVTTVIAAAAGVAASGASFQLSCGRKGLPDADVHRDSLVEARRLSSGVPKEGWLV